MPDADILDVVRDLSASRPDLRFRISSPSEVAEWYRLHPEEENRLATIHGEWPFGWGNTGSIQVAALQQNLVLRTSS